MIASVSFLSWVVGTAVTVTAIAPFILLYLWIKDWKQGQLW